MRRCVLIVVTFAVSLFVATGGAQALVVHDQSTSAGVALVPGTCSDLPGTGTCTTLQNAGVSTASSSAPCRDPALTSDLGGPDLPSDGVCYHSGAVMQKNESFALTWNAAHGNDEYWSGTRGYVEQFLRDVADGSAALGSPYALTSQYSDGSGRAQNSSIYGGGCIDNGAAGGSACEFGAQTGAGHGFPANGCTPTGDYLIPTVITRPNDVCLTDAQLKGEVSTMVAQTGILGRTQPGHTPVVVLLMPPGVETCLDGADKVCSANGSGGPPPPSVSAGDSGGTIAPGAYPVIVTYVTASGESLPSASRTVTTTTPTSTISITSPPPKTGATGWYAYIRYPGGASYARAQAAGSPTAIGSSLTLAAPATNGAAPPLSTPFFCSYHSQVDVGGTEVAYVVQSWTAYTACDEPDAPPLPSSPSPQQIGVNAGIRLVSPLSQAQIAAIVNPGLNAWSALDGSEINDNGGCLPLPGGLDSVTVGGSSQNPYLLQREFNNAGAIESEPNTYFGCAPGVILSPMFVVPSAVNQGDEIQFDGSASASTLLVPNAGYAWDFGDGTTAVGPSVVHAYTKGGSYSVQLTVTDRGGNVRTLSQTIVVLGPNGQPVTPGTTGSGGGTGGSGGGHTTSPGLRVHLQLLPQGLRAVLRAGVTVRVSSNKPADGFASLSISRRTAQRAHIKAGRAPSVVIGRGTVSGIRDGTVTLHLRLSRAIATKLGRLRHVTLTVRLAVMAAGGDHLAIDAAGRY